jgi:3-hydroxyisobutyrate dehydrogenase-like beta-hydroxyacid dehydrogenase
MINSIAVLMPGDMGHAIGQVLADNKFDVITCLNGRSERTRLLAKGARLRDLGSLDAVIEAASIVLSILPPKAALKQAELVAQSIQRTSAKPIFVDCNAISPVTAIEIASIIQEAGAQFIDAGIIGLKPDGMGPGPRFYVSGIDTGPLEALDGMGIQVKSIGSQVGRASALKMCYAGLTKGTWALHAAVFLAAEELGLAVELKKEFQYSQPQALSAMEIRTPRLPADSDRWIGEMEEISKTFADVGVPPEFHEGAAEIYRILAKTPFSSETRENYDANRTMEETIRAAAILLDKKIKVR